MRTHAANSASSIQTGHALRRVEDVGCPILALPREHHQPLVMLFCILLLELTGLLQRNVGVLHGPKIRASISFNDYQIAWLHLKTRVFLDVKNIGAMTFESHNVKELVLVEMRERGLVTAVGMMRHRVSRMKRVGDSGSFISHTEALLVGKVRCCKVTRL